MSRLFFNCSALDACFVLRRVLMTCVRNRRELWMDFWPLLVWLLLPSLRWWRRSIKTRWQWINVLAVHLKPPILGISALVKLAHHLVSRQYARRTDGCGSEQPRGYTWASNAFVEGRIPSQKCQRGFQPRAAEPACERMSLILQLRAGLTG